MYYKLVHNLHNPTWELRFSAPRVEEPYNLEDMSVQDRRVRHMAQKEGTLVVGPRWEVKRQLGSGNVYLIHVTTKTSHHAYCMMH